MMVWSERRIYDQTPLQMYLKCRNNYQLFFIYIFRFLNRPPEPIKNGTWVHLDVLGMYISFTLTYSCKSVSFDLIYHLAILD